MPGAQSNVSPAVKLAESKRASEPLRRRFNRFAGSFLFFFVWIPATRYPVFIGADENSSAVLLIIFFYKNETNPKANKVQAGSSQRALSETQFQNSLIPLNLILRL